MTLTKTQKDIINEMIEKNLSLVIIDGPVQLGGVVAKLVRDKYVSKSRI